MKKARLYHSAASACAGLILIGLGWCLSDFYLLAIGAVVLAACVAWLCIPMPAIL